MDNKRLAQQFRQVADALDFAAASEMMSDRIRWWVTRSAAHLGFDRPVQGREAVMGLMSGATDRFYKPGTMKREYHSFVAEGTGGGVVHHERRDHERRGLHQRLPPPVPMRGRANRGSVGTPRHRLRRFEVSVLIRI